MWWLMKKGLVRRTVMVGMAALGILLGIALTQTGFIISNSDWLVAGLLLLTPLLIRSRLSLVLVLLGGLMLGSWRGSVVELDITKLQSTINQEVNLTGTIADDAVINERGEMVLLISGIHLNNENLTGNMRLTTKSPSSNFERGDKVAATGKMSEGFGNYQATIYSAEINLLAKNQDIWLKLRNNFASGVRTAMSEPQSDLGLGFVVGERSSLTPQLDDALKIAGLTHVVVASGYNLTILVRVARRLFAKISRYQALVASLGLTLSFVMITGFSPSMSRAALVTILSLWAWYYGRRIHPAVLLLFAAALTGLVNPLFVWADLGWYLSFLAFAGVLILAPLITRRIYKGRKPSLLNQVAIESIAAQILTLPLLIATFGYISVVSLLANVVIVPFVPLAMLLTFLSGVAGMFISSLSQLVGAFADSLIGMMIWFIQTIAAWPWVYQETSLSLWLMFGSYVLIAIIIAILWRKTKYDFKDSALTD